MADPKQIRMILQIRAALTSPEIKAGTRRFTTEAVRTLLAAYDQEWARHESLARQLDEAWRHYGAMLQMSGEERLLRRLYHAGYRTLAQLRRTPDATLLAVRGIGPVKLARIRRYAPYEGG